MVFIFSPLGLLAQDNLVPNPSFEEHIGCPEDEGWFVYDKVPPWNQSKYGDPAYYNECYTFHPVSGLPQYDVPENTQGFEYAHTGQAYAAIYAFKMLEPHIREYLQVELTQPIVKGMEYSVGYYVNLPEKYQYAVNKMGMYFSSDPPVYSNNNCFGTIPQIVNDGENNPLTGRDGWTLVSGTFESKTGGEKYITIGNFFENGESDTVFVDDSIGWRFNSVYFIDDVFVIPQDTIDGIDDYKHVIGLGVFPNPTSEQFTIQTEESLQGVVNLSLYNAIGEVVFSQNLSNLSTALRIDVGTLSEGVYLLELATDEGTAWEKVIIRH